MKNLLAIIGAASSRNLIIGELKSTQPLSVKSPNKQAIIQHPNR
jgi:hypothetical protein